MTMAGGTSRGTLVALASARWTASGPGAKAPASALSFSSSQRGATERKRMPSRPSLRMRYWDDEARTMPMGWFIQDRGSPETQSRA